MSHSRHRNEVLGPQGKSEFHGFPEKYWLVGGGDQTALAALRPGIGPASDVGLINPDDLGHDLGAAEDLDNCVGWFEHKRIICADRNMSNGIRTRKTRKTVAARSAHTAGAMMDLAEITPEWVKARMKVRRLKQAAIASELGITQDKVSKSLNHKREFTTRELELLSRFLDDPRPVGVPTHDPETAELLARIVNLPQAQKDAVRALLTVLEQVAPSHAEKPVEPDDPKR